MRPLEITIEGLRSFREPVTLDFRGRDQIAIVGDTGAGKSSIIEAITYSLYGQPTFSGPNREELMNDTATMLRVALRFQVSGEEWEVVRTLRRRGSGTVGSPSVQLRRFNGNGDLLEIIEQVRQVNERIESVIGLNRDAFLRTTVLPQGRFAQLLVTDNPADRSNILRQVWRTEDLEQAAEVVTVACQEIAALRGRIEHVTLLYPEDPVEHLSRLREQAERAGGTADAATAVEREATDALDALRASDAELALVHAASKRVTVFDASVRKAEIEPISVVADEIGGRQAALRERQDEVAKGLSAIPSEDDGPSVAQVAAALTALDPIPRRVAEAADAVGALEERAATAEDARKAAERVAKEACRAADVLADHDKLHPSLEQTLRDAERIHDQIAELHAAALEMARTAKTRQEELADYEWNLQEVAEALHKAAAETVRRAGEADRAEEHLAATRRTELATVVAGKLHPGDKCPICRRVLAQDWEAPGITDLHGAEQEAQASRAASASAREAEVALATRRDVGINAVEVAEERFRAAEGAAAQTRRTLTEVAALDAATAMPEAETLMAPLRQAVAAAKSVLAAHAERRDELARGNSKKKAAVGIVTEAAASAERLHAAADQSAVDAMSRLRDAVTAVPDPYRLSLGLPVTSQELREPQLDIIQDLIAAAREREWVLTERAESRDRLTDLLSELATEQAELARQRSSEVDDPLSVIMQRLSKRRDLLSHSAIELCLELDLPDVLNAIGHEEVAARIDQLIATTKDLLQAARDRAERATFSRAGAQEKLQRIGGLLAGSGGRDGSEAIVACSRTTAESARYVAHAAQESADGFAEIVDHVADLRKLLAEVLDRERALTDLTAALKEGGFPKWLTLRRSRSLLVHASRTLEQISAGRYAFVEPADEFDRWRVLDRDSGQPRSPASLSGGEQFIASMALALGMVEMMARSGGSLETLFLDEGFGSLDRSNLDAAIEALGSGAAGGRAVVLISHVHAVAEQVANVARVTRTPTGSSIRWLSNAERDQFVELETGTAALSGLLE